jgi:hypothetical protein
MVFHSNLSKLFCAGLLAQLALLPIDGLVHLGTLRRILDEAMKLDCLPKKRGQRRCMVRPQWLVALWAPTDLESWLCYEC